MYRGFNLELQTSTQHDYNNGMRLFRGIQLKTIQQLEHYIGIDGVIDGSELESDWFSEIQAHIFISHSHADREKAIALSGYLYEHLGLTSFIDSCVWGYCNDLLKQIDNRYCLNSNEETYSYETRNFSTSHVHMMLASALNKMIDKCECLFFINTPNSVETSQIVEHTYSPWIYSEILTSKLIQKKVPSRHLMGDFEHRKTFSKADQINESLKIKYKLDLDHLEDLTEEEVINWGLIPSDSPEKALDTLYNYKPARKNIVI